MTRKHLPCILIVVFVAAAGLRPARAGEGAPAKEPTAAEVEALVKEAGEKPPGWLDSVQLTYPKTLGLDWQRRGGKGWQPDVNLGAHMISRVYPHPDKWRYGIKLLTHALTVNAGNAEATRRTCDELGRVYGDFLGDQPRAAYWWRRAGNDPVKLADCYRLMGARTMAAAELRRAGNNGGRFGPPVKIWGELGELSTALQVARSGAGGPWPEDALLAAGNACRFNGDCRQALTFYEAVVNRKPDKRNGRQRERAGEALKCLKGFEDVDVAKVRDGTHVGSCKGFRGPVQVEVTVAGGRITGAKVKQHRDDWSGRSTFEIPAKIVEMNGIKGVDAVTRATTSSDAVINAAAAALKAGAQ